MKQLIVVELTGMHKLPAFMCLEELSSAAFISRSRFTNSIALAHRFRRGWLCPRSLRTSWLTFHIPITPALSGHAEFEGLKVVINADPER